MVGLHPDKVMGALQQHIDSGHEKSVLQAIPDLQLQHPQFYNELEQHKARLSARLLEGVKVLDRDTAQVFRCVNCGGGLSRQNPESKHVICQYCGCNALHPAADIQLERWNKALDLESNFTIGDFFEFENQRWQAIGVQLYSAMYTNWWMLNEHRELAWLVDDGKSRYWAEKFIPDEPFLPSHSDSNYEHGEWKLEFAAGEFSYQPQLKAKHRSSERSALMPLTVKRGDGAKRAYYISVETRLDTDDKPKEIEFVRSRKIPNKLMLLGLGKNDEEQETNRWRHSIAGFVVLLPALLATALYLNRGGAELSQSANINTSSINVPLQSITVDEAGTTLEFNARLNKLSNNSWMGVDFHLEDNDSKVIYTKYIEYWPKVSVQPASTNTAAKFQLRSEPNRASLTPFMLAGLLSIAFIMACRSRIDSLRGVASSIAVKLRRRFDPKGKPKREREEPLEQP